MADLYFRCGSKSEADSLVESAREFAEKHEMSIEHVIFDRQDGRTIMLNMYADSAVYREPTTLLAIMPASAIRRYNGLQCIKNLYETG